MIWSLFGEVASTDATQNDLAIKTPQLPQPTQEDIEEEVQPTLTKEPTQSEIASLNTETEKDFKLWCQELQTQLGTDNLTDTVYTVIKNAYNNSKS